MMRRRRIESFARDRGGIVATEFALIAPFLLALLFGAFEVSSLVRASLKLSHAASNLAKIIAQQPPPAQQTTVSVTKAEMADFCTGAGYVLAPYGASTLSAAVVSITTTNGTVGADWEDDAACATAASSFKSQALTLAGAGSGGYGLTPNAGDSLIVVRASYAYTPLLHYVLGSKWTLTQTAFARPRVSGAIQCADC